MPRPLRYKAKNPLDRLLQGVLTKKRKKEKYRLFKEYIQANDKCSEAVADSIIARYQNEFYNYNSFIVSYVTPSFLQWLEDRTAQKLSKRGKKGSSARWKSKNR